MCVLYVVNTIFVPYRERLYDLYKQYSYLGCGYIHTIIYTWTGTLIFAGAMASSGGLLDYPGIGSVSEALAYSVCTDNQRIRFSCLVCRV